uniref:Uncharacterized protein n=1 Tax=Romanomermis culicivorax TaxID=13658 RepID=A0A915I1J3_ROMCU
MLGVASGCPPGPGIDDNKAPVASWEIAPFEIGSGEAPLCLPTIAPEKEGDLSNQNLPLAVPDNLAANTTFVAEPGSWRCILSTSHSIDRHFHFPFYPWIPTVKHWLGFNIAIR